MKRIILTGGGTAGHVTPNIALIPELKKRGFEIHYIGSKTGIEKEQYEKIFDVDLLIIDDLGTETMSNVKFTELFNIINTRLLKNKKILISTNLTLNQLYKEYDEGKLKGYKGVACRIDQSNNNNSKVLLVDNVSNKQYLLFNHELIVK